MKHTSKLKYIVIFCYLAVAFPFMKSMLQKAEKPNLTGMVLDDKKPVFSLSDWYHNDYQPAMDDYNNDMWLFKEILLRLNNQLYYKAFNQLRVNGFVAGKNDFVFSEGYIFSAFGDDYIGRPKILTKLQKAKVLQDTLKKKGIDLMLAFAPGKGEYYVENIEDKYKHPISHRNYSDYISISKDLNLNVLNLTPYILNLKSKSPYPLFTTYGHHWSSYCEAIAADTIIKYIEHLHHCDMPNIKWDGIAVSDTARGRDADILKSMNLYENPEQTMKLGYPNVVFENAPEKNTTRVLTVSGSDWWGPVYLGIPEHSFAKGQFWYYYNKVIPSPVPGEKVEVWQLDLKQGIESNQVIMLLYSDSNLSDFAGRFIEDAYEMYTDPKTYYAKTEKNRVIKQFEKQIREKPALLKKSTKKSQNLQIPLDSAIRLDALKFAGIN